MHNIYQKFLQRKCSPEEAERLIHHFNEERNAQQIQEWIDREINDPILDEELPIDAAAVERNWNKLSQRLHAPSRIKRISKLWRVTAACIVVFLGTFALYTTYIPQQLQNNAVYHSTSMIIPGGKKATLTLADGESFSLSDEHSGIISGQAITYSDGTELTTAVSQELILSTPRGGEYQVTLSDGTVVWLNAASSLTYPSIFKDKKRVVQVTGEAFFEVAHDAKRPFTIITGKQEIEVLGTKFNVQAYNDLPEIRTTLVEGRVKISTNQYERLLKPGQQARLDERGIDIYEVNTKGATAWLEGKFSFDNKSFKEIMHEIGRWYDLRINYQNKVPDVKLVGDAYRDVDIDFVLNILELSKIKYKLNETEKELIIY
ncbi:FecR family protein [Sphingobacterium hotanense]|uniref:FecR family protein n=1 Tax=Sphingobacterium hotanense TaxID=649196 RepID=UPI0011F310E2|nr:FecR family protein [Sphingobacterium hotanense]